MAFRPCGLTMKSLLVKRAALVSGHGRIVEHDGVDLHSSGLPYVRTASCRAGTGTEVVWLLFLDGSAPKWCYRWDGIEYAEFR